MAKTLFPYLQNINVPLKIDADFFLSDTPVGSTNQMTNWDKLCTFSRREIKMNISTSVNKILILSQQEMINFHTLDDKYLSGIPKSICIHLTFKIKCTGLGRRAIIFCRIKKSGMTWLFVVLLCQSRLIGLSRNYRILPDGDASSGWFIDKSTYTDLTGFDRIWTDHNGFTWITNRANR